MARLLTGVSLHGIHKKFHLRQVLSEDFPSIGGVLPISGGWGYSLEDAIIIDKDQAAGGGTRDFVSLEYLIAEKRTYEELIIFRQKGDAFAGIERQLKHQHLIESDGRFFDHLVFDITCFHDPDWNQLKSEMETSGGNPDFDFEEHFKKREALAYYYEAEFYFDITSCR